MMSRERRRLIRPATRTLWREGRRTRGYSFIDFLHGYVYARWAYHYIGWAKGDRKLPRPMKPLVGLAARLFLREAAAGGQAAKRAYADRYHGKVVPTDAAEQLVSLDSPVELRDLFHCRRVILEHRIEPLDVLAAGMQRQCERRAYGLVQKEGADAERWLVASRVDAVVHGI